jgi:hypothetical protein
VDTVFAQVARKVRRLVYEARSHVSIKEVCEIEAVVDAWDTGCREGYGLASRSVITGVVLACGEESKR